MNWAGINRISTAAIFLLFLAMGNSSRAANDPVVLEESSFFDIIRGDLQDTVIIGNAVMSQAGGHLRADTAIWIKGDKIILRHNVFVYDSLYQMTADLVNYDLNTRKANAFGSEVIIYSVKDSIRAVGTEAVLIRDSSLFRMNVRPTMYLNYPDSARLIRVTADLLTFEYESKIGYADGNVKIIQQETESESGRAIMYGDNEVVVLLNEPVAKRRKSEISGDTLIFFSTRGKLDKIHVLSHGEGKFNEPTKKDSTLIDRSELTADEIIFNLIAGELDNVVAGGQAYSYYEPGKPDSSEKVKNIVSGDSIKVFLENEDLELIQVIGGAEGEYHVGNYKMIDSVNTFVEDTVFYRSDSIRYTPQDSTISLINNAAVSDRKVSLTAAKIDFNTARDLVTAYSDTSIAADSTRELIPVVLKDGEEEMTGVYLEYSLDTERGMIKKSRSAMEESYYGGDKLYKAEKEVFYVKNGSYTSCEYEDSHYHFYSTNMKVINNDRVIARPVVFYIEKIPLMIIPYYVFSLKDGRHSGFLPFQIGSFSRGGRQITNVGYYWAASEYWDVKASMDYYENFGFNYNGQFNYNVRYKFNGYINGSYSTDTRTDDSFNEIKSNRWQLQFNHHHEFSPTFKMDANGTFISDKDYYTDFSLNEEDRLNRSLRSQVNFSKKFGSTSITAQFLHTDQIDDEIRTDYLPTLSISFPSRQIFGTPEKDEDGRLMSRWYHNFYLSYGVSARNYSYRKTDTLGARSRKEYLTVNHSSSLRGSFKIFSYINFQPSFSYQETWYKIFETDQSDAAGIDAGTGYRRHAYSASVGSSTDLYGTIYPNLFGLNGLRHVLSPGISFSWAPEIDRHDNIRSYTGAGGGGAKRASVTFSLRQLFQTKVQSGEHEKKLNLLTLNSSLSYNFESETKKFSNLTTSAQTSLLKNISISASIIHDLYKPGTDELDFFSPYLQSFNINTTFSTSGVFGVLSGGSTENKNGNFPAEKMAQGESKQRWSLSLTHHYAESGKGASFNKTHDIRYSLRLDLTSNMNLTYSQYYSFDRHKTVSRFLELHRKMHCFEGKFTWNIDRSPQGFGFKINVIMIPEIKYEKSQTGIRDAFF